MRSSSPKHLAKPMDLEADRSWEEVRYCWQQISGEDLSRQRVMQIAQLAIKKLQRLLHVNGPLKQELLEYLPPDESDSTTDP